MINHRSTIFQIVSYENVGPIRFGITSSELVQTIGTPRDIRSNFLGELEYQYAGMGIRFSAADHTVVEIGMNPDIDARLGELSIFNSSDAFGQLMTLDGYPLEYVGFIILINLGITLTGFHDNDASQRSVTAFQKGRWDGVRSKCRAYIYPPTNSL